MPKHCKNCNSRWKVYTFPNSSFFSAILIILIPKCPFCIMAYSSAITICGGQDIYMTSNNWVSYIPLVLSAIVILMIIYNNKGTRTWIAASMALISALFILLSHQLMIPDAFYNVGGVGLIVASWTNGNLMSFVNQVSKKFRSKGIRTEKRQITYPISQK